MLGETTISYVKIGNHPIETTIYKWLALGFQEVVDVFFSPFPLLYDDWNIFVSTVEQWSVHPGWLGYIGDEILPMVI